MPLVEVEALTSGGTLTPTLTLTLTLTITLTQPSPRVAYKVDEKAARTRTRSSLDDARH